MKIFITFLFLILNAATFSCEFVEHIDHITEENYEKEEVENVFRKAWDFLNTYKDRVDFDLAILKKIALEIESISTNVTEKPSVRSQAYLYLSGIHAKMSDKLRSNGGIAEGKIAYKSVKAAMAMDATNKDAVNVFATMIYRMIQKNFITRKLIESSMKISLAYEAKEAVKVLEKMGLTSHPGYETLKDY